MTQAQQAVQAVQNSILNRTAAFLPSSGGNSTRVMPNQSASPSPLNRQTRSAPTSTPGDGSKGYDVVLRYRWGGEASHHTFPTLEQANKFASDYRRGVYSLQDGTLTSIDIVPLGNVGTRDTRATARSSDLQARVYNPPTNMPALPKFNEPTPTALPTPTTPPAPVTPSRAAPVPIPSASGGPTASQGQSREAAVALGVRIGARASNLYERYIEPPRRVASFPEEMQRRFDEAVRDPRQAVNQARKMLVNEGLNFLESLLTDTGDPWLQGVLNGVFRRLHELNEPSLAEQSRERLMDRYGNR